MPFVSVPPLSRAVSFAFVCCALLLACSAPQSEAGQNTPVAHAPTAKPSAAPSAPTPPPARRATFLWKTQSASAEVFLLGSIHVATAALYPLDERIEDAFEQSDTLVFEIELDDVTQADAAQLMMAEALLPKGQTVMMQLDAATQDLLAQKLHRLNVDVSRVAMFKPWFVGVTISLLELENSGFSHEYGIDRYFYGKAVGKKRVLSLETVQQQLAAFKVLEEDGDAQSLKLALETDTAAQVQEMVRIWKDGDVAALDAMLDETRAYPKAFDAMFTRRNKHMAQQVHSYLAAQGKYFVVAGAGHMVGKGSVLDELQRYGHTVVRQ